MPPGTTCTCKRCFCCIIFPRFISNAFLTQVLEKLFHILRNLQCGTRLKKRADCWLNSTRPFHARTYLFQRYFLIEPHFVKVAAVCCSIFSVLLCFLSFFSFRVFLFFFVAFSLFFLKKRNERRSSGFWAIFIFSYKFWTIAKHTLCQTKKESKKQLLVGKCLFCFLVSFFFHV